MQPTPLWQMLAAAGWTMIPLYVCSLAAVAVIVKTALQYALEGVGRRGLVQRFAETHAAEGPDGVATLAEQTTTPLGRVVAAASEHLHLGGEVAQAEASRVAVQELDRYEAWLPVLSFITQVAPLFGLLGTVLGMVELFGSMEAAGAEISTATLSGGIWKALLTTAAGLMVAIPTLGAHLWFSRVLRRLQHDMEVVVGRLVDRSATVAAEAAPAEQALP